MKSLNAQSFRSRSFIIHLFEPSSFSRQKVKVRNFEANFCNLRDFKEKKTHSVCVPIIL